MIIIDKALFRDREKAYRKAIAAERKAQLDSAIAGNLFESEIYRNADSVCCYASFDIEISTDEILRNALQNGKRLFIPRCLDKEFEICEIADLCDLERGRFGIREPAKSLRGVGDFSQVDLFLIPALLCDKKGNRLGFGAGFYDRSLASYSGTKAALCYFDRLADKLPADKFDVAMDYLATDKGVIRV